MRKLKPSEMKYFLYFMIIVFGVSSFSFVNLSSGNDSDNLKAYLSIVGLGQDYYQEYSVPKGANLYYLLQNTGFINFQSDYSVKCVGSYCNDYVNANYWQVFLGGSDVGMDYVINGSEQFTLYYGKRINFVNISLTLNASGFLDNSSFKVPGTLTLLGLLESYNSTFINGSLSCLFGLCGNWTVLINDELKGLNYSFMNEDIVYLELE